MISQALLNRESKLLTEVIQNRYNSVINGHKPELINVTARDYFNIIYRITNPKDDRYKITIEVEFPLLNNMTDLVKEHLKEYYKNIVSFNSNSTAVLTYDLTAPMPDDYLSEIKKAQFVKRACIYAIMSEYLKAYKNKSPKPDLELNVGRKDKLYLMSKNGLFLVYKLVADDPTQFMFLKNFTQELKNIQKYNTTGPITQYSESNPPPELEKYKLKPDSTTCYLSILFDDRYTKQKGYDNVTDLVTILPMQIYYSIANYNTFFISRLRDQSVMLLKCINRSKYVKENSKSK